MFFDLDIFNLKLAFWGAPSTFDIFSVIFTFLNEILIFCQHAGKDKFRKPRHSKSTFFEKHGRWRSYSKKWCRKSLRKKKLSHDFLKRTDGDEAFGTYLYFIHFFNILETFPILVKMWGAVKVIDRRCTV